MMKPGKVALLQVVVALLMLTVLPAAKAALTVHSLTIDHRDRPLGLDSSKPSFSWKLASERPATLQSAYELRVHEATSGKSMWSSGRVSTDQSLHVGYAGAELKPRTRYEWQVRVWDNHDRVSEWSAPSFWETGLMQTGDWEASWITYPWQENTDRSEPSPMLRRAFSNDCPVAGARLYITALGLYEAHINGQRVGEDYFTPGWTSYDKRLQYQVYDVGELLSSGDNTIGIRLADGWYRGYMTWEVQRNLYGDRLAARAQLRIQCRDGGERIINTDPEWTAAMGAIRSADIYNGEDRDLRLARTGWSEPGYDDRDWQPAIVYDGHTPPLVDSQSQPVRAKHVLHPIAMHQGPNGETIVDMGQNMVGWVRLRARGKAGDKIVLHHAEVLGPEGGLYREPLRSAQQRVSYTLADDQPQVLEPGFTFQGFRYVSIEGYPGELSLGDLEGVVLYSDMPETGHFETSSRLLNQLHSNIVWGQRGNFLDIPTDCPQRDERMGWTGDAQVFARTAMYNTDSAAFFSKWLADVRADQHDDGAIPNVVPDVTSKLKVRSLGGLFISRLAVTASGWGDAITEIPMAFYERYGDSRAVSDNYDSMKRWVEYQRDRAGSWLLNLWDRESWFNPDRHYIWSGSYTWGDWLAPEPASYTLVNTAYFARSARLLAEAARILGKGEDADEYTELYQNIRGAFQRRFYLDSGRLTEDVQGAYVLALAFDLLEPEQAERAADRLNQLVIESGNHLATGFLSTPQILPVLEKYGYLDTAYNLLMQREYPSWLYPISKGATTVWERWGSIQPDGSFGDNGMNSFNHYAFGAVGDWMYRHLGGISPLSPGYKIIRVAPHPGAGLDSASTSFDSPYGRIATTWRMRGDRLLLSVEIPANTRAQLHFPGPLHTLAKDGEPIQTGSGIASFSESDGKAVIELGSGRYQFSGAVQ